MSERNQTALIVDQLKESPAWLDFTKAVEKGRITFLTEKVLRGNYKSIEEYNRDIDRLETIKSFINSPQNFVGVYGAGQQESGAEDPYYSNAEQMRADEVK